MTRVLIVAEGAHERNDAARMKGAQSALEVLVRRIWPGEYTVKLDRIHNIPHVHRGKGRGYEKKAIRWAIEAKKRGHDALILLVDRDKNGERISEIENAQTNSDVCGIPRALGVAVEQFDAWMLADEVALSAVFGGTVQCQKDPEEIADAKMILKALAQGFRIHMNAGHYAAIAEKLDTATLERRCPCGFGPFAQRVRELRTHFHGVDE